MEIGALMIVVPTRVAEAISVMRENLTLPLAPLYLFVMYVDPLYAIRRVCLLKKRSEKERAVILVSGKFSTI